MSERDRLVLDNLDWAERIAVNRTKGMPRFVRLDDLKSAAYLGLVEAATRFRSEKGVPFTAWAAPRVLGSITDWLRELGRWKFESLSNAI